MQEENDPPDEDRRCKDTYEFTELLIPGGCAYEESALQVLRGVACNRGRNAYDCSDAERHDHIFRSGPTEGDEYQARPQERRYGHSRDRVGGRTDQAYDSRRYGNKEKGKDGYQYGAD